MAENQPLAHKHNTNTTYGNMLNKLMVKSLHIPSDMSHVT
jgi:hypothetical protein